MKEKIYRNTLFWLLMLSCQLAFSQNVGIGTEDPQAMLDINGDLVLRTGDIVIMDSLTLTLDVDTPRYSSYRLWLSGPYDTCVVAGLTPGVDGRIVTLYNRNSYIPLQLNNEDETALPGSGIMTGTNKNLWVSGGGIITMQYDTSVQRWVVKSSNQVVKSAVPIEWLVKGNSGINPDSNFLGTIDSVPLRLRLFNQWAGELNAGNRNYFIGDSAGIANTMGIKNTGIGSKTLPHNTSGNWNTAVGAEALYANTTGNYNAAFGFSALDSTTTGYENSAFGTQALRSNTVGAYNTATGVNASFSNTTGSFNTANGGYVLFHNTQGIANTAAGYLALYENVSGSYNTAIGVNALSQNRNSAANTALGAYALWSHRTLDGNTALGTSSLYHDTSGVSNTAVGNAALFHNINGKKNIAVGSLTLFYNKGSYNTAVGCDALSFNNLSSNNVAIGDSALYFHSGAQGFNTAIGSKVMPSNTQGYSNTAGGYTALYSNTSGHSNTALGQGAGYWLQTGNHNISIGYGSGTDPGSPNTVNTISIGNEGYLNAASNQAFIGNLSTGWIGGQTTWFTYASDARVKDEVSEDVQGLNFIKLLRPVTYHLDINAMRVITGNQETEDYPGKYDVEKIKQSGFLAQEVEQAAIASGYDFSGITIPKQDNELYTVSYAQFVVPLVKAVQEQQVIIDDLKKSNADLLIRLEALEKKIQ
ncbi:MAG: tail fiber domain-containing protein [Saprospiraceae bacterium]|nr:tail fiber domain-containing protein [Candidatus Opimibacter iunctus]